MAFRDSFVKMVEYAGSLEFDTLVVACVVAVLVLIATRALKNARGNFPPGPLGFPVVGYFPFLSEESFLDFMRLGEKYGDVFSVQLGSEQVVVLNSAGAIREAFMKPEFLGRPPHSTLEIINKGSPFFMNDMPLWKQQRRFVVHALKDLGLGKTKIEGDIQDEVFHLLDVLGSAKGSPVDIKTPLSPSMSNNISALVFGKRLKLDDPDRVLLDTNLDLAAETLSQTDMYTFFNWITCIPFAVKLFQIDKSIRAYGRMREYFKKEIDRHKKTLDPDHTRDLIDVYLLEMEKNNDQKGTELTESILLGNVTDVFGAGSETVRNSILWALYTVAAYPDVQARIQGEIRRVVGDGRIPEFADMRSMPYTHAAILELQRWKTIVPLNVLHYTVGDTTVGDYDIPRKTIVISNLWNAHHDPREWADPDTFRPERFLSEDGQTVVKPRAYMPFSIGRRVCPGETMAYMEIFLYFTSILQKFNVVFPEGVKPAFKAKASINYRKEPYKVRFIKRAQ